MLYGPLELAFEPALAPVQTGSAKKRRQQTVGQASVIGGSLLKFQRPNDRVQLVEVGLERGGIGGGQALFQPQSHLRLCLWVRRLPCLGRRAIDVPGWKKALLVGMRDVGADQDKVAAVI